MKPVWLSIALGLLVPSTANAILLNGRVLYQNDFEAPAYVVGQSVVGTDGWAVKPGESGSGTTKAVVAQTADHGKVLYNYRGPTSSNVIDVYHDLGPGAATGRVRFSFDAKRTDTEHNASWFYLDDSSNKTLAYFGLMTDASDGLTVHTPPSQYLHAGPIVHDEWYRVTADIRFSGTGAGTYDLFARNSAGVVTASMTDIAFPAADATAGRFHVRTYGTDSGVLVDNLRLEQSSPNRIRNGDFDGLLAGTKPDNGQSIGGWQVSTQTSPDCRENSASQLAIADKPGGAAGDRALRVNVPSPGTVHPYAEQLLSTPYVQGPHKFIVEFEQTTVAGKCGVDFLASDGSTRNCASVFGLRDEGGWYVRVWPNSGSGADSLTLASWTPGNTYQFRVSTDLETDTFDLYIRGGEYARWKQIGKNIAFTNGTTARTQIDRIGFGQYFRPSDSYVDNVVAVSSADLPMTVHYTNNFNHYTAGSLIGQDGWTVGFEQSAAPLADRAQVVADPATGIGNVASVQATRVGTGYSGLYQDLDAVVDAGTVAFSVDARWTGTWDDYAYFVLGDSTLFATSGKEYSPSAAIFGFRRGGFLVRPGDGAGTYGEVLSTSYGVSADPNSWYTFVATMNLTGPDRNTWGLQVFNRDTHSLLWSYSGIRFTTDYTDITRLAMFVYDMNTVGTPGTLYFDNLQLADVPEPAGLLLLAVGGLLTLAARRPNRNP